MIVKLPEGSYYINDMRDISNLNRWKIINYILSAEISITKCVICDPEAAIKIIDALDKDKIHYYYSRLPYTAYGDKKTPYITIKNICVFVSDLMAENIVGHMVKIDTESYDYYVATELLDLMSNYKE